MKKTLLATIAAALALTSCGSVSDPGVKSEKKQEKVLPKSFQAQELTAQTGQSGVTAETTDDFVSGVSDFSAEFFKQVMTENQGNNVLISPESVLMCMGMVANGAEGETLDELTQTLVGGSLDTLNKGCMDWYKRQNELDAPFTIKNANSAWLKEGLNVKQDYLNTVSDVFGAVTVTAPFDDSTVNDINIWCSNKTDGMIPDLLDRLPDSAKMVLINAICFEGEWQEQYENYQCKRENFTSFDGSVSEVTMLNSVETQYVEDGSATGFVKPYEGSYSFMAVLPNEGISVFDYAASMTGETLSSLYKDRTGIYDVECKLPEFSYDWDGQLIGTLANMGIHRAFDEDNAEFSGMTDDCQLYVNQVIHKTHIELDRNGTKAAAATAALMTEGGVMEPEPREVKQVYLDRPFIYAIIDCENGLPVFIGCVNQL